MKNNDKNRSYWNNYNSKYIHNWEGATKEALSQRELGFVNIYLPKDNDIQILDIGVGNGRVVSNLVQNSSNGSAIWGIDISENMCEISRDMFKDVKKVKEIGVCDVSKDEIPFKTKFDFVSSIRVVKYNKEWKDFIANVHKCLNKKSVFVFTMLNKRSLSKFADYGVETYLTDYHEITEILQSFNFEILEISSFSKLPAFLYTINNRIFAKILIGVEKIIEGILGNNTFGKEFFIAVKKE